MAKNKLESLFQKDKTILEIELNGFTEEQLLTLCSVHEMNIERFAPVINDRRKVRGLLLLPRFPRYIELIKEKYPKFPIRWADNITPSYPSLRENKLYTKQNFLFRLQTPFDIDKPEDVQKPIDSVNEKGEPCKIIEFVVRIELTRKTDEVIVLGGIFTLCEEQKD